MVSAATPIALTPPTRVRVGSAALFQAFFVAGVAVLKAAAVAMVVARLGAQALPPIYIAAAVVTAAVAPVQGRLFHNATPPRTWLLLSALVTCGLGWLASGGTAAFVVALFLWAELYATLTALRFWGAMGEIFDPRQSKDVFAKVSGAGMAGSVLGGLFAVSVGEQLGSLGFVLLGAASMVSLRLVASRLNLGLCKSEGQGRQRPEGSVTLLRKDNYAQALALLAALMSVLTIGADYAFRLRAGAMLSENQLAALFGEVNLWVGAGAMLFQFFLAGRMLRRFGIFRYLLVVPTACLGLAGASVAAAGVWPVFALKVVETIGSLSINPTALQLLYAPLPDSSRQIARASIDGMVRKGGLAVAGMLLWALGGIPNGPLALGMVGVAGVALLVAVARLKYLYVGALDARLRRARWSGDIVFDGNAKEVLLAALASKQQPRVLLAMSLLESQSPEALRAKLPELLRHPSERVRERAVQLAERNEAVEVISELRRMVQEEARRPRYAAVQALSTLDPAAIEVLRPLLSAKEPGLRAAIIAALVRRELALQQSNSEATQALAAILAAGGAAPAAERREAARLLVHLADTGLVRSRYAAHLEIYLCDEDASVRRIAAAAAKKTRLLNLVPALVDMLGRPAERRAAREALAAYGDDIVPVLAYVLNHRTMPASIRHEVPRMLRYVGTAAAADVLLFSNIQDDAVLRYRIALALSRMRRQHTSMPMDAERIEQAIGRRIDAYMYYSAAIEEMAASLPPTALMLRALQDRLRQNLEIIFRLLGLLAPHDTIMRAYGHLAEPNGRARAYALELLENIVPAPLCQRVLALLEPAVRPTDSPKATEARLNELAQSRDETLAKLAAYTAVELAISPREEQERGVPDNVIEKVFLIEGVDIFAQSDVDDLMALASIAKEKHYTAGASIYETGDAGNAVYVIVDGRVRIEKDGQSIITLGATESFGETSLLDGAPRPASAIAAAETRVLWIERQDFLDLVSDRPELLKAVFSAVSRNLRRVLEVVAAGKLELHS